MGASGVLLMAIASGTQPDMALGADMSIPVEYGMRGAVVGLSRLPEADAVTARFVPGSLRSYQYQDELFALPETIDMPVLFVRTDVLEYLNIDMEDLQTWQSLCDRVIPVLKQNGMDFWYEAGFPTLLYQQGGDLYTQDGLASALDTPEAFAAFRQFTEFYQRYEIPVAANFYTRFRAGQMPLGVAPLSTYMLLQSASPEILGKFTVLPVPATRRADGTLNGAVSGTTTAAMILKVDKQDEAWKFLQWYTSEDVQQAYAQELLTVIGNSAMWFSANTKAFDRLPWSADVRKTIDISRTAYIDNHNVIGGYITTRHIENARVRTVIQGLNYRESLEISVEDINRELKRKNKEFAVIAAALQR